jgi:hypothetical protein
MNTTVVPPLSAPETAPLSEGARLVNTFIAPTKTFTDLRRSAAWWGPFLVLAVVSWLFVYIVDNKVGFRKIVDNQIQMSPKGAERLERMPADQRARTIQQQVTITKYISWGFPAFLAIWYGIVALILFATFKVAFSAPVSLWQSLGIVWYSALPQVLKSLLAMLTLIAGASADSFTFQNPVATNPGYFMNRADAPFLYGVATSIDIFMIWTLILAGIGFAVVGRLKRSSSLTVVFVWYAILAIGGSALGAAVN